MATILDTRPVASAVTLTNLYVTQSKATHLTADYIDLQNCDQVTLDVSYTMGAAETSNSLQLKLEFANPTVGDPVTADWHQETAESVSSGTITTVPVERSYAAVSAAATYDRFSVPVPVSAKYMRVSWKETGIAANGGTLTMKATLRREESFN